MKFRAVIFDLDGTLADTLEDIADAMNRTLSAGGYPTHHYGAYRFLVGKGMKNLVAQSLPEQERCEIVIEKCYARMLADYTQNYVNKTHLYDGIPELLDELFRRTVKMAVLSNKDDVITRKICCELFQNRYFEMILGSTVRFPRKPNPQAALFIAGEIQASSDEIIYIGDSDVDMQTASAAGFYAVGAGWGFRPEEELLHNGARKVIRHPRELLPLFDS
ncbi:MAG: HAD family hydrolase [Bacteroidales bacterium]|jgi:phosphoglycolate phosphatase|nr:HAD family hydrolase [Bacteroidales bacterium]